MRDIRQDLRDRIEDIGKRRTALRATFEEQVQELDDEEESVNAMLAAEERRFGKALLILTSPDEDHVSGASPLSRVILDIAKSESKWLALADFKRLAANRYDFGKQSPGRTLHRALVGLTRSGRLECTGKYEGRRYKLKQGGIKSERATLGQPAHVN